MKSNYKRLGDYIEPCDEKNFSNEDLELRGISNQKYFQKAKTNTIGVDLSKYRIVRTGQFAFNRATTRNGDKLSIALSQEADCIVSPSYRIFKSKDENILNSEYLMMWFKRPEFDRFARFKSHGSAHEFFDYDEMCEVELPIPSIQKQREIVKEYNTIVNRIALNEKLNQKLEETAQAIYRQWFVEFEFPNEDGKPYKSSGGKMVWCEELEKEIPEGWKYGVIGDLFTFQRGHDLPSQNRKTGNYPIFASTGFSDFHNEYKINKPTIITGRSGSLGQLLYVDEPCWPLNTTLYIIDFKKSTPFYSLYYLQTVNLKELGAGSAVPTLNRNDLHSIPNEFPDKVIMNLFDDKIRTIRLTMQNQELENQKLGLLQELVLAKMTKVESEKVMIN